MESNASGKPKPSKEPRQPTVVSNAIDASFQAEANVRESLADNLKPRRAESEAIDSRLKKAFEKFDPNTLSRDERAKRQYVALGASPAGAIDAVVTQRVKEMRANNGRQSLRLRDTAELRSLVKKGSKDSPGKLDLGELIDYIDRKSRNSAAVLEPQHAPLTAGIEADKLLDAAESSIGGTSTHGTARRKSTAADARDVLPLVKDAVNVQMESVTAPEAQLTYGKIPNSADDDETQQEILQTFQLRPGASDVTAYHDFHTLQIAFAHVWSRIFDGQLTSLGQDLYREYVRLKDFSGSNVPDLAMGSLADLRRLMDEIRKLSQFVDEEIPTNLRPTGSEPKEGGLPTPKPEDAAKVGAALASGGVTLFIEWAFNELIKAGNSPQRVKWTDFPLKLNEGRGNIIELRPPEQNALPPGAVEIVLETDSNSYKKKITFQQWDPSTRQPLFTADLQNFGGGKGPIDRLVITTTQAQNGTLKFISEDELANDLLLGRYVLGELGDRLKDRTRLTFRWKGQR
jgi:hypothetical protein